MATKDYSGSIVASGSKGTIRGIGEFTGADHHSAGVASGGGEAQAYGSKVGRGVGDWHRNDELGRELL
jgi:hypothetical protein